METSNDPIQISKALEEQLNLTNLDESEEYILTSEEELYVIDHHIKRARDHREWRFKEMKLSPPEILLRMAKINFEGEIDKKEILKIANSNKHQDLWHKERREKEKKESNEKLINITKEWTAYKMYSLMKFTSKNDFGKDFILNEHNKNLITTICFFISGDKRLESELGYSFKKGLMIRGVSGLGKTYLLRCVEKNELNPILIVSMLDVADDVRMNGEYQLLVGRNEKIYLDDVGTEEPTVVHYGTRINYFKNFIEQFYLRNQTFEKLIISTNNSFDQLESKYGFRVRSRIKDMFNIVDVTGTDMRGEQIVNE